MKKTLLPLLAVLFVVTGCPEPGQSVDPTPDTGNAEVDADLDPDTGEGDGDEARAASIEFEEPEFIVEVGRTRRPEALVLDQFDEVMENANISWSSSDDSVMSISSGGFVIGQQLGAATLTASVDGIEADWPGRVVLARVVSVEIVPANFSLLIGSQKQYLVSYRNANNAVIEDELPVTWSTSDSSVATIDEDGLATGVSEGQVEVTALVDGVEDAGTLTVSDVAVESVQIQPQSHSPIYPNETIQLSGKVFDLEGNELQGHTLSWSSADEDVAVVDDNGLVRGVDVGTSAITASIGELEDSVDVEVFFTMQKVATGGDFSCAVAMERLFCWGANDSGQLADGSTDPRDAAEFADFTGTVDELSLGESHGCLLDDSGDIWCWGNNSDGQLGMMGSFQATPQRVTAGADFRHVSAGASHTCAVSTDDDVWCWGNNDANQLGHSGASTHVPQQVASGANFFRVAAGASHTCAIATGADTSAYCWGANERRQLGGSTDNPSSTSPIIVDGGNTFNRITAGQDFTCGTSSSGPPVCWGAGDRGQLGNDGFSDRAVPRVLALPQGESISTIHAGALHACALAPGGGTYCWGAFEDGRLGFSSASDVSSPQETDLDTVVEVDIGETHGCARTSDHEVFCWGQGHGGVNSEMVEFVY